MLESFSRSVYDSAGRRFVNAVAFVERILRPIRMVMLYK